jgi:hypothetical protein
MERRFKSIKRGLKGKSLIWLTLCLLLVGATATSYAQIQQQLSGRVTDAQGAVIPQAAVTATNQATTVAYPTQSDNSGVWVLPYLPPATYTVTVGKAGFKTETVKDVTLNTGQLREVDTTLQIGQVNATVTVTADALALQTYNADSEAAIPGNLIANLPQNYRNVSAATVFAVGMGSKNGLYVQLPWGSITGGLVANSSALTLNLDGANNQSTGFQAQAYIPLVDTVQEVQVDLTPYDAGAVGFATAGNVDVHLKTGTNVLHGDIYDYYRSAGLDANTWTNKYNLATQPAANDYLYVRPRHQSQQFGFEADGPVVIPHLYNGKDKTFFTVGLEFFNLTQPQFSNPTFSIPGVLNQPSWLTPQGSYYELSGLAQNGGTAQTTNCDTTSNGGITLYDPLGPVSGSGARTSFYDEGAPNCFSIPTSRVNQTALAILKNYPAPNLEQPSGVSAAWLNNYFDPTTIKDRYRNWVIKIDHNISPQDRVTLRWGRWYQYETETSGWPAGNPAAYGEYPYGQAFNDPYVEWVHTFNPHIIFDFKATVNMDENHTTPSLAFNQSTLGLQNVGAGLTQKNLLNAFPQVNLSNTNEPNNYLQMGSTNVSYSVHNQLSLLPSLTVIRGPHEFHIGMEARIYQISTKQGNGGLTIAANQYWTQKSNVSSGENSDGTSGSTIASFLLDNGYLSGSPGSTSGSLVQPAQVYESYHYWGLFLQDNWKVNSRLTLNLGARYSIPSQVVDRHNRYTDYFNPTVVNPIWNEASTSLLINGIQTATTNVQTNAPNMLAPLGGLTFAGVNGVPRQQIPRPWYFLEPRFGIAYRFNEKTVFMGGIGMAWNNDSALYTGSQIGFSANTPITGSLTANYAPAAGNSTLTNSTPALGGGLFPAGFIPMPGSSLGYLAGVGGSISYYNQFTKSGQTWSFSAGVQRQLSRGDILLVQYVGKQFVHAPTGYNQDYPGAAWYAQCNSATGGNPSLCTASNTPNPFQNVYGFQGTSLLTAAKIQSGQLTQLYPQYTGVSENGAFNYNGLWLNSLQMSETHRFANNLTATSTYEYARIMDNNGIFDYNTTSALGIPNNLLRIEDSNDLNHRVTVIATYPLPIGKGRQFLGGMNQLEDDIVGGWNVASQFVYESGRPWQPQCGGGNGQNLGGSTSCFYLPNGTGPMKVKKGWVNEGGVRRIRAATPCVATTNTSGAIINTVGYTDGGCSGSPNVIYKAAYAPAQNLVSSGIRLPATSEWDANLSKSFKFVENYGMTLKVDAFNVDNHPVWGNTSTYSTTQTDGTWGALTPSSAGQGNKPRYVQLSATVNW